MGSYCSKDTRERVDIETPHESIEDRKEDQQ